MSASQMMGLMLAACAPVPVLTYLQATNDDSNLTTYSFASQNFGTASATRYIIACFGWAAGTNVTASSCTIGGVTATKAVETIPSGTVGGISIWIAAVPTGTTGTVAITLSGGAVRMGMSLYAVTDLWSPIPTATSTHNAAVAGVTSGSLNVKTNGIAVGVALSIDGIVGYTWVGLTKNAQVNLEASAAEYSSASTTLPLGATPLAWSAQDGAAATRSPFGAVAAFR